MVAKVGSEAIRPGSRRLDQARCIGVYNYDSGNLIEHRATSNREPSDCRYIDLELPEAFALETRDPSGRWVLWGTYEARSFERMEDGGYVSCTAGASSPTFLRCVARHGGWFEHEDGGGELYAYRIVALPVDQI